MCKRHKFDFRDVSVGLQMLRAFLLGREHMLHNRFTPLIAPRSIPPPDIPRAPEYKYSKQYYLARNAYNSVNPPVVAPVGLGPPLGTNPLKQSIEGGIRADSVCFNIAPTPGPTWWWDGHCYFGPGPDAFPPSPPCGPPNAPPCVVDACGTSSPGSEQILQKSVQSPLEPKPK